MTPSNIEQEVAEILRRKGGWLRTQQCSEEYAKDDNTKRTRFYRWYKKVEQGKVGNFQVLKFPGNISFIGLKSADPKIIERFISEDEKAKLNVQLGKGFFAWMEMRSKRERLQEIEDELARLAPIAERYNLDFLKKYVEIRKEQIRNLNE